jgi:hypothetical protein
LFSILLWRVQKCFVTYIQKGCGSREPLPFRQYMLFSTSLLSTPFSRNRAEASWLRRDFFFANFHPENQVFFVQKIP